MSNIDLAHVIFLQNPEDISISLLQRKLILGYSAACQIMNELSEKGIIKKYTVKDKIKYQLLKQSKDTTITTKKRANLPLSAASNSQKGIKNGWLS